MQPDEPLVDPRSELSLFRTLGQMHGLRAYSLAVNDDNASFYWDRVRDLEKTLGQLVAAKVADPPAWLQLEFGLPVERPDDWRKACYDSVPDQVTDHVAVGAYVSVAATAQFRRWDVDSVQAPPEFKGSGHSTASLLDAERVLKERAAVVRLVQETSGLPGETSIRRAVEELREGMPELGSSAWSQWAAAYDPDEPTSPTIADRIDLARGAIELITDRPGFTRRIADVAPEVLITYLRWRGATLNTADLLQANRIPGGSDQLPILSHQISSTRGGAFNEAMLRTQTPALDIGLGQSQVLGD